MASEEIINLEALLKPISDENPTGDDVRDNPSASSPFQIIKNERNLARAAERQSIHDGESNEAAEHWRAIVDLAPKILKSEAKDLEVACWLAEAMIRKHGFAGLKDAFQLINGLIDNFWESIHPMPDEYGMETRVSCLSGLNGEGAEGVLIAPIRKIPITQGDHPGPFSLWKYHQALDAQKSADEQVRANKIEKLGFSQQDIEKCVEESSEQFYVDIRDDLEICIDAYKTVGNKLDELCGADEAPPTRTIIEILDECLGAVNHIGKLKFPVADTADETTVEDGEHGDSDNGATTATTRVVVAKGPIASREEAFKQLHDIAEYFRKTEPHSPVSYVIEKAVKWGNMPLGELVNELITDHSSRERYSDLTGVNCEETN